MTEDGRQISVAGKRHFYCLLTAAVCLISACTQKSPPSVVMYGTSPGAGSAGVHTILPGDSVYTISKAYNLPIRDIVEFNSISAPYTLTTGYRLKLPPPREYKVKRGDTMAVISKMFDASQSEIARLNNLQHPYNLKSGMVLRMPTPTQREEFEQSLMASAATTMPHEQVQAVAVPTVEREVLSSPLPPVQQAGVAGASGMPPQPVSKPAAQGGVQQASATTSAAAQKADVYNDTPMPRTGSGKFMWPISGKVISAYGPKDGGLHNDGINIKAARGAPVRAAQDGTVVFASNELQGYGNMILVRHKDRWMTAYAHMDKMLVKKGDKIKAGQSIGTVGTTGQVDFPQLHFEVRRGTEALDPKLYL